MHAEGLRLEGHGRAWLAALRESVRTRPWQGLLVLAGASAAIYGLGLAWPYQWFALKGRPLLDIAKLTRGDPLAQACFVLTFAGLSGAYYLAWRLCRRQATRAMWWALAGSLVLFNLVMLWLYPVGAADIFDNILRGRITAVHGGNPFYETPRDYRIDLYYTFTAWRDATSAYGPAWELLAAAASALVPGGRGAVFANVLIFKAIGLAFYTGCLVLIALLLRRFAPGRALQGVCLFGWNPLVIYETAGNGHNDIVMTFFVLLGVYALARGWHTRAALALTGGALVKFIPALLVPVAVAAGLRAISKWPGRWSFLLKTGIGCAALVVVFWAPFLRGPDVSGPLGIDRRVGMLTASLPALVQAHLEIPLGLEASQRLVTAAAVVIMAVAGRAGDPDRLGSGGLAGPHPRDGPRPDHLPARRVLVVPALVHRLAAGPGRPLARGRARPPDRPAVVLGTMEDHHL
jgi:hypothetical protein